MATISIDYGKFMLKAGQLSGTWTARAFLRQGAGGRGFAHEATGKDAELAIEALKAQIDEEIQQRLSRRRHDDSMDFDVPTVEDYTDGLRGAGLTDKQLVMLRAHAAAADAGLTAQELAEVAGYRTFSTANLHYNKAGKLMAEAMDVTAPETGPAEDQVLTGVLARGGPPREDGEFVWVMHPELRDAIKATAV